MRLVCERSAIEDSQSNISHCISVISNALMKTYADADLSIMTPFPRSSSIKRRLMLIFITNIPSFIVHSMIPSSELRTYQQ
jgi:hypothetical protein